MGVVLTDGAHSTAIAQMPLQGFDQLRTTVRANSILRAGCARDPRGGKVRARRTRFPGLQAAPAQSQARESDRPQAKGGMPRRQ